MTKLMGRSEAEAIVRRLRAGSLQILERLRMRLHVLAPNLLGKDAATVVTMMQREMDQAAGELAALQKSLTAPTEH